MNRKSVAMAIVAAVCLLGGNRARGEVIWYKGGAAGHNFQYGSYAGTAVGVTFGVWPVAPGHSAGAVWTTDGWRTVHWSPAQWAQNVPGSAGNLDEEWRWAETITCTPTPAYGTQTYIWFAVYVDNQSGQRSWDNNNGWNYQLIAR